MSTSVERVDSEHSGEGESTKNVKVVFPVAGIVFVCAGGFALMSISVAAYLAAQSDTSVRQYLLELLHLGFVEVGVAFVVSAVVAGLLEEHMHHLKTREDEKKRNGIREDVFNALFKRKLKPELILEMYRQILVSKFVRDYVKIVFTMTKSETALLKVRREVTFETRNLTGVKVQHTFDAHEYVEPPGSDLNPTINVYIDDVPQVAALIPIVDSDPKIVRFRRVDSIMPSGKIKVAYSVTKLRRTADTETWISKYSASSLMLTVVVPDSDLFEKLQFAVSQSLGKKLKKDPTVKPGTHVWSLDGPVLPHRGIMLFWRTTDASTGAGEPMDVNPASDTDPGGADPRIMENGSGGDFQESDIEGFCDDDRSAGSNVGRLLSAVFLISIALISSVCVWTYCNTPTQPRHNPQEGIGHVEGN